MNILKVRSEMRKGRSIFDLPLRVTFYARVSTDKSEQLNSLENQVQYYTELIQSKPNWTYIPGYIDEGISGTSTKKRDSFLRMIRDAKAGRFDFIITKEISRFSRSTLDSIQYTQELLEHDVGVLFQNDNINTMDPDSEFRLTIMAGVAQDEVRKLSERLKFGFNQAIKNGHVLGNDKLWGYDKKDCVLTINQREAAIIRQIFDLYANQRLGIRKISQKLYEEGYTSRRGNAFNELTIRHILCNPKYKGWYCAGKSQTVDYRTKRRIFLDEKTGCCTGTRPSPPLYPRSCGTGPTPCIGCAALKSRNTSRLRIITAATPTVGRSSARPTTPATTGDCSKAAKEALRYGNARSTIRKEKTGAARLGCSPQSWIG